MGDHQAGISGPRPGVEQPASLAAAIRNESIHTEAIAGAFEDLTGRERYEDASRSSSSRSGRPAGRLVVSAPRAAVDAE